MRSALHDMNTLTMRSWLLAATIVTVLGACGGGDETGSAGALKFASQMRAANATGPTASAATLAAVTPNMTLDWAEYKFAELFPRAIAVKFDDVVYEGVHYTARLYAGPWGERYLGITPDGRVFGLGDFTNNQLQQFDDIAHWSPQILADQCSVYPGHCVGPWATPSARTLVLVDGNPMATSTGRVFTLRPDGTASMLATGVQGEATWTAEGAVLELTMNAPVTTGQGVATWINPATGASLDLANRFEFLGLRLQHVAGDSQRGTVRVLVRSRGVWVEGPPAGQTSWEAEDGPGEALQYVDIESRLGVLAAELNVGSRLAGVPSEDVDPGSGTTREDILRIDGPGTGIFELSGKAATWSLQDGWLTVRAVGLTPRRFTRLLSDPATGLESWLEGNLPDDPATPATYFEADLLFAESGLVFTAETATRRWRTEGFSLLDPNAPGASDPDYVVNPDGSVSDSAVQRWQLAEDGALNLYRVSPIAEWLRQWIPLRRVGSHWISMEVIDLGFAGMGVIRRINWQVDLGPAGG